MQVKKFLTDDDAVSPVIGVILMVAITVILAAVIAAFVLGLGDTSDPAPQVSFDYDYGEEATALNVTVQSGDTFQAGNVDVVVAGTSNPLGGGSPFNDESVVSAGDSFDISSNVYDGDISSVDVNSGERVDITFTPDSGGESNVIGTFTAPE